MPDVHMRGGWASSRLKKFSDNYFRVQWLLIDDYTISVFRRSACDNFVISPESWSVMQLSRTNLIKINIITLSVPDKFYKIRQLIYSFVELLQQ